MFICGFCQRSSAPREQMVRVVTHARIISMPDQREGQQIAREVPACQQCALKQPPVQVTAMPRTAAYIAQVQMAEDAQNERDLIADRRARGTIARA